MPAGKSIIQTAWEQLDDQVLEIIELTPLVEECRRTNRPDLAGNIDKLIAAKARARGKAEILALLTVPHFTTADQVSEESGRRLVAIQRGDASYRTPGLEDAQVSR